MYFLKQINWSLITLLILSINIFYKAQLEEIGDLVTVEQNYISTFRS